MTDSEFAALVRSAEEAPFSGWDFSWLRGRIVEDPTPWSYVERARELARSAARVLDVGTGGGEVLASVLPVPGLAVATESFEPNVGVASRRLRPLDAWVVHSDDEIHNRYGPASGNPRRRWPFGDEVFDLVLARHSSFSAMEVARILTSGGRLLTQQVGARFDIELNEVLGISPPEWLPPPASAPPPELSDAGFTVVDEQVATVHAVFKDVGAVVYHLRAIPWLAPDFDVRMHGDGLRRIHEHIRRHGGFTTTRTRSLTEAVRDGRVVGRPRAR